MRTIDHWINGSPVASSSGKTSPVFNPATGHQQATVGLADIAEVDAAVAATEAARRLVKRAVNTVREQALATAL